MENSTVFDSVFKTMIHKAPQLLVPFINEVFGRNYPEDSEIIQFNSEHEGHKGTIIDDSVFRLQNKIYHVECQSTPDSNMVLRMIEYDFAIALKKTA
jgi:predicted transposase/invertase (TIGR01784 family)